MTIALGLVAEANTRRINLYIVNIFNSYRLCIKHAQRRKKEEADIESEASTEAAAAFFENRNLFKLLFRHFYFLSIEVSGSSQNRIQF